MIDGDGQIVIGTEIDTDNFDSEIAYIESQMLEIEEKLKKADMGFDVGDTQKLEAQYSRLGRKLDNLNQKQANLNKTDLSNIQKNIDNIGNGISKTVSKVGKWALAVFAVEGACSLVRNAMGTLSQYNEKIATDVEYIQFALASMLQPVIERLIGLVVKLLQYINYIAQAWFGVNLFANASASSFDKARGSTKKMAKDAKEMNKSLASGIDEITNLDMQNNSDDSSDGSGASGIKSPSFDLSGLDGEVPGWLKWIADNRDIILSVMAGIAAGLLAWKSGLGGLKSLGIGIAITGIVYAIQSLIDYLKDPSFENFGKIIQGIGIAIIGIGIAIGSATVAVIGAVVLIMGIIIKYWDQIKSFLQGGIDWLAGKSEWIHNFFGDQVGDIYDTIVDTLKLILIGADTCIKGLKQIFDGLIMFVKGIIQGDWKMVWEGAKEIVVGIFNAIKGNIIATLGAIVGLAVSIGKAIGYTIADVFKAVVNGVMRAIESILNAPIKTVNRLIGVINKVPGINLGTLPTFKLPRLAKGGIVNNPGKGVNMGNYVAGERGAEAVIPLQNSKFISDFAKQVADESKSDINTQLLLELNKNIQELANQPIYFIVNGQELAKATYGDFQNEEKRQQKSATVIRS